MPRRTCRILIARVAEPDGTIADASLSL